MADKPWKRRLGFHSYVREHPRDDRLRGPDGAGEVRRRCGKHRAAAGIPPSVLGS